MSDLPARIRAFVDRHGKSKADYDPQWDRPEERFNGPDPGCLLAAADAIDRGDMPDGVFSSYGSGCYAPWPDAAAEAEHDALVAAVRDFRRDMTHPKP